MENTTIPTVPAQPQSTPPLKKGFPILLVLVGGIALIGIANISTLVRGHKPAAQKSALTASPATVSPQQVKSYQAMQAIESKRDAELREAQIARTAQQAAVLQEPQVPGPEADAAAPMTVAQRQSIYGDSPNAPQRTSGVSQGHAEAKQRELLRQKEHMDEINSDTVAIDFARSSTTPSSTVATGAGSAVLGEREQAPAQAIGEEIGAGQGERADTGKSTSFQTTADQKTKGDPMSPYGFDGYQGKLYRVFEGTVLQGVVTNHIDGSFSGPILVMLTADYYSHDHQQLLMPQGTRLIGNVSSVSGQGQRKLFVTFHRAVCPDGFSLEFDKYVGLDPIGTTGLAGKVDNHYLSAFAAAAAIGGLGGLAQIGNTASVLTPSSQLREGISEQSAQEGEQILNHFLNRLPTITLKEGLRARVYIGRDILIPSYVDHRVDPTL